MGRSVIRRIGAGSDLPLADDQVAALGDVAEQMREDGSSVRTQEVDVPPVPPLQPSRRRRSN